jgi:Holliday junction resolvase RusA-like endonuclease
VKFTIYGNQENPKGNPIGYHRTTQGSFWNKGSKRYYEWKHHVVNAYLEETKTQLGKSEKPINLGVAKAYLHTMIYYATNARPDPDNVQKGIADALFVNDKSVAGSYDFAMDKKNPRVEVSIEICATS